MAERTFRLTQYALQLQRDAHYHALVTVGPETSAGIERRCSRRTASVVAPRRRQFLGGNGAAAILLPPPGLRVDDLNSFDDQYLNADDVHRLLEALDFFIGRGEDNWQWREVPAAEREEWLPYRILRARLQEHLGMSEWDDAASWLDKALRSERRATLGRVRAEVEKLLNDAHISKNAIRQRLFELAETLENTRLTSPPPRPRAVQPASSHRDRTKEPIQADNWRRRDADYEAQNKAAGNQDTQ